MKEGLCFLYSLNKIYYEGTNEDWDEIELGEKWHSHLITVVCKGENDYTFTIS